MHEATIERSREYQRYQERVDRAMSTLSGLLSYFTHPDWVAARTITIQNENGDQVEYAFGEHFQRIIIRWGDALRDDTITEEEGRKLRNALTSFANTLREAARFVDNAKNEQQAFLIKCMVRDLQLLHEVCDRHLRIGKPEWREGEFTINDIPYVHAQQFLPADRRAVQEVSGETREFTRASVQPRIIETLRLCDERRWEYERHIGVIPVVNMNGGRLYEAIIITLPAGRKVTVFATDAPNSATYVVRDTNTLDEVLEYAGKSKAELRGLRVSTGRINWLTIQPDWGLWRASLSHLISKENEGVDSDVRCDNGARSITRILDGMFGGAMDRKFVKRIAQVCVDHFGVDPKHIVTEPTWACSDYLQDLVVKTIITYRNPDPSDWKTVAAMRAEISLHLKRELDYKTVEKVLRYVLMRKCRGEGSAWYFSGGGKVRSTLDDGQENVLFLALYFDQNVCEQAEEYLAARVPPNGWRTENDIYTREGINYERLINELEKVPAAECGLFLSRGNNDSVSEDEAGINVSWYYEPQAVARILQALSSRSRRKR